MRRTQIYLDGAVDDALTAEAQRLGVSKAQLIRAAVARDLPAPKPADPWEALIGWLDNEPVDDIDAVIYGARG